ncbi:putative membrane protein YphA (DoxX/SURF4 family) [Pedobacter sp. W3I1]|uniref:MauE/DoxX family redox-associated membrane protein n=1 Tax=Pedobacter sp. W3I1 TaxID=3042291 RepID=UPI002782EF68|nr:MauE/DoxX family redox-associated membrane protein [Pedobacter sp. W3I1]MDQ0640071.1 putative membrane protein YphA (DoxX/SURF4 family) [Pedobacter sp. W3I1]
MKAIFKISVPPLLVLLFVYAALSKLFTFSDFDQQLHNQSFPSWLADFLLYFLIPAEIITALLLCFKRTLLFGLLSSAALLLAFTSYIAMVMLHFWDRVPCSCGGILNQMGWSAHLVFNSIFLIFNLIALYLYTFERKELNTSLP